MSSLFYRPDSKLDISNISEQLLRKADAIGVLPTPIEDLIEVATITEIGSLKDLNENFFSRLKKSAQDIFINAIQKVRGIADLRDRIIYIPNPDNPFRKTFTKAHDLGHQVLPWHKLNPAYLDDDITLSQDVEDLLEKEANFFASEIIFQGNRFRNHARNYSASFDAIFKLSDLYGVSKQSTLWRYVEEQDEIIAIAQYYPASVVDNDGEQVLKHWKTIPSPKFLQKYGNINLPSFLEPIHPWVAARDTMNLCDGKEELTCGGNKYIFEWQAWWNGYTLFILLRRRPTLRMIGNILQR